MANMSKQYKRSSIKVVPTATDHSATAESGAASSSKKSKSTVQWKSLFNFATRKHISIVILGTLCAMVAGGIVPVQSYLLGRVFGNFTKFAGNQMTEKEFKNDVLTVNLYFVALGTGFWIFSALCFAAWAIFGELQARSARERLFKALIDRNMEWFDQRKDGMGAMATKLQSFIVDLQTATAQPIGFVIRDLTTTFASLGLALFQSWKLTLVIIATLPIAVIIVPLIALKVQPAIQRQIETLSEAAKHVTNSFTVIETVKCCNGQGVENWRYAALLRRAESYYYRQINWSSLQNALLRIITLAMFVQGFWYGSSLVNELNNKEAAGQILTAFWSCIAATGALMSILPLFMILEKGKVAGDRLRMMMVVNGLEVSDEGKKQKPAACAGDIKFEDVHFAYPTCPQQPVLRGVNLFFAAGDLTFLVGQSGSGKSTIGQLLMQFYAPTSGTICLDGSPVQMIDVQWLRSHMLLVEQTSVLFNTTVEENISLGGQEPGDVTLSTVAKAAQFASVDNAIRQMPRGYRTRISTKGGVLSGGQRQRVALARAKIRDPEILILDESTSALDYVNRMAVMDAIRKWRQGRSTIIITHDISQILPTDFVYVMKDGSVVQSGFRKAMEEIEGSPFQDFTQTPKKAYSKRRSLINDMILPVLPEDAVLDSDESDDEAPLAIRPAATTSSRYEDDPVDWYLDTPVEQPTNMWTRTMFNPNNARQNRQSVAAPAFGAPVWSVMPSNRMTNVFGTNAFGIPNLVNRDSVSSDTSHWPASVPSEKRQSGEDYRLSSAEIKRFSSNFYGRPKSVYIPPKATEDSRPSIAQGSEDSLTKISSEGEEGGEYLSYYSVTSILSTVWPNFSIWQRFGIIIAFINDLLFAASTPLFAFVFSKLLTTLYDPVDRKAKALVYSLAILGIAIGDGLTLFISNAFSGCLAQTWVNELRQQALARILEQPKEFFEKDENAPSKMAECLDQHAEMTQHILGKFVGSLINVVFMVLMAVIWSMVSCWKLTLVLVATLPALLVITGALSAVGTVMERRKQEATLNSNAVFAETFGSIKTVRTLTLESYFERKHTAASDAVLKAGIEEGFYVGIFYGLSQSILFYLIALVMYYASVLLIQKAFSLEDILQVLVLLLLSVSTATMILTSIPQLSVSQESASRVLRLVNLPATSYEHEGKLQVSSIGEITLTNVNLRYPTRLEDLVLKDVSLQIPAGSCVALVGTSGSGKSTIAAALLKLYQTCESKDDPAALDITVGSRSIHQTSTSNIRNLVSIVSQTPTLFPTSISGNIVYGLRASDPRNSAANVRAAAISAGIHDFVSSLPQGYDTIIGDGGMGLSGGQAQRVAIARALARQPDVLILDEATSALDVESASVIRSSIQRTLCASRLPHGKPLTVIIITHAREMMEIADKIVMLEQGRVVEEGGYEELISREGHIARLLRGEAWDRDVKRNRRRSVLLMNRASGVLSSSAGSS